MDFNFSGHPGFAPLFMLWWVASVGLTIIIHIAFAVGVWANADSLRRNGIPTIFVGPEIWAVATLFGGIFVATAYWIINQSNLRRSFPEDGATGPLRFDKRPEDD